MLKKDSCEIWASTQYQTGNMAAATKVTGLKPEQIKTGKRRKERPARIPVGPSEK
jgi:hypothetical protein